MNFIHSDPDLKILKESDWYKELPGYVKEAIETKPPNQYYRIHSGHVGTIYSYEDASGKCVSVAVGIHKENNAHLPFERKVFGVPLEELVPCEAPSIAPCKFCLENICHQLGCTKPLWDQSGAYCEACTMAYIQFARETVLREKEKEQTK